MILSVSWPVAAQNLRFLADTPYTYFTKEDQAMFWKAVDDALDQAADGEARSWSNPNTRANGELRPVKSYEAGGLKCRRLAIANKARGRANSGEYDFCKQTSGEWKISN